MHKRKISALVLLIIMAITIFPSCKKSDLYNNNYRDNSGSFSVHFMDVGHGDCTLIYFSDGKTMLIDTGNGQEENDEYILGFLENYGVEKIDYLVLTHPDANHIGGTGAIAENVQVSLCYVPHILDLNNFPKYKTALEKLTDKGAFTKVSCTGERIIGAEYLVAFLTPYPPDFSSSSYDYINKEFPSDSEINNVSPFIYVEYKGISFLFTGDGEALQEETLLNDENMIVATFQNLGVTINLNNIDFLKVAEHGAEGSTTKDFIRRITPKNAVISVDGLNSYGYPSTRVLSRLSEFSPEHNLYRTDVYGTISVYVDTNGKVNVITD